MRLEIHQTDGDVMWLSIGGDVGGDEWEAFRDAIVEAADQADSSLVLDLTDVTYFDSSAIRGLIGAHLKLRDDGVEVVVGPCSPLVDRVLEVTGVRELFAEHGPSEPVDD